MDTHMETHNQTVEIQIQRENLESIKVYINKEHSFVHLFSCEMWKKFISFLDSINVMTAYYCRVQVCRRAQIDSPRGTLKTFIEIIYSKKISSNCLF